MRCAAIASLAEQWVWGAAKRDQLLYLLGYFSRLGIESAEVIDAYAVTDAHSRLQGIRMGKNDIWIAATAQVMGATLLSTDRDFDHLHPPFVQRELILP